MLLTAYLLCASLAPATVSPNDCLAITQDVVSETVAAGVPELAEDVIVWASGESNFDQRAVRREGDTGLLQLRSIWFDGHTAAEVLADRRLAIRLWIRALDTTTLYCGGDREAGMRGLASGRCDGARGLVAGRRAIAEAGR